jgi:phospholipase C
LGEALIKEVYEVLRAAPTWSETLFIITYDEHGGYYDHVSPPSRVPAPPISKSYPDKFDFTRLGVRIPTLAISPWVPKGLVVGKANGPFPGSEYDTTSILATMRKLFNFSAPLTVRDAWSGSFEHILSEPAPRSDCPLRLPDVPISLGRSHALKEAALPLNDLQKDIVMSFRRLRGMDAEMCQAEKLPTLQGEASEWIAVVVKEVMEGKHILADRIVTPSASTV